MLWETVRLYHCKWFYDHTKHRCKSVVRQENNEQTRKITYTQTNYKQTRQQFYKSNVQGTAATILMPFVLKVKFYRQNHQYSEYTLLYDHRWLRNVCLFSSRHSWRLLWLLQLLVVLTVKHYDGSLNLEDPFTPTLYSCSQRHSDTWRQTFWLSRYYDLCSTSYLMLRTLRLKTLCIVS